MPLSNKYPMEDYEKLLDTAYAQLPKKATSTERFEIPELEIELHGSKTIIRNFDQVLNTLRTDADFIMKYLSKELAVPVSKEGPRLVMHGKILKRLLIDKINAFVKKYVLCSECGRPDTKIVEVEKGIKIMVCEACGARTPIK